MVSASAKLGRKDAANLAKRASVVIVAKGKKVSEFKPGGKAGKEVVDAMLGPTGNLRAPTIPSDTSTACALRAQRCPEYITTGSTASASALPRAALRCP